MNLRVAFVGFGEAGQAFAADNVAPAVFTAFDCKTDDTATRQSKQGDYEAAGVVGHDRLADALREVRGALSLVTADKAVEAAQSAAALLPAGAMWLDMNSVAPESKLAAAELINARGGRYVDVAIMAPVHPARRAVPLLISGPDSDEAAALLRAIGFTQVRPIGGEVGSAAAIKMIRSVMIKGVEALTAECFLAAQRASVVEEVAASLDASASQAGWLKRADYNLERIMVHGVRRAAELDEVVKALGALGMAGTTTRGASVVQLAIGALGRTDPPTGLHAKLEFLAERLKDTV
jgi:3-hydroxyisobutyrate dehydrogenase-like beta-hydroxyacid dehydrogenase